MFSIDAVNLHWLEGAKEEVDLCLHGKAIAQIGDEHFEYDATVSSTALYLLKSLTEDHVMGQSNRILPCCGFSMFANEDLSSVEICGCNNGIDWSVLHEKDSVVLVTESGNRVEISTDEYRQTVFAFADKLENFYKSATPKVLPTDEFDRNGYIAFWNEWTARRYGELTSFILNEDDNIRMGFADSNQKEQIPPIYYAKVKTSDGRVVFNHDGVFQKNFAVVMDSEGKFGLINRNGIAVIPLQYDSISNIILKNIVFFRQGSTCGFMNINQTILAEYPNCTSFREVRNHMYAIEYNGGSEKKELDLTLFK